MEVLTCLARLLFGVINSRPEHTSLYRHYAIAGENPRGNYWRFTEKKFRYYERLYRTDTTFVGNIKFLS